MYIKHKNIDKKKFIHFHDLFFFCYLLTKIKFTEEKIKWKTI